MTKSHYILRILIPLILLESLTASSDCTSDIFEDVLDCSNQGIMVLPIVWNMTDGSSSPPVTLKLNGNAIESIEADSFQGLDTVTDVDLTNNNIQIIDGNLLCSQLPNLKVLRLAKNLLISLPDLRQCSSLTELSMSQNKLHTLQGEYLNGLHQLSKLNVSRNNLTTLSAAMLPSSESLKTLLLNGNAITTLAEGTFERVPNLEKLRLDRNSIHQLPENLFKELSQLSALNLGRNKISRIEYKHFAGLTNLLSLSLERNDISRLPDGSFYDCEHLSTLDLSGNAIENISIGAMFGLKNLRDLNLQRNRLSSLLNDTWAQTYKLQKLDLSKNSFLAIQKAFFSKNRELNRQELLTLILSDNKIQSIEDHSFEQLTKLETLDLNGNRLGDSLQSQVKSVFQSLDTLVNLNLANNSIQTVSTKLLDGMDSLQSLNLNHNPITIIESYVFAALQSLRSLSIDTSSLVCDCKISWFPPWIKRTEFQSTVIGKCSEPTQLRGSSIYQINTDDFICKDDEISPKPMITESLRPATSKLNGTDVVLTCSATTNSVKGAGVQVEWRKDSVVIPDNEDIITEIVTDDGRISLYRTFLTLRNLSDSQEGEYQCGFQNSYGSDYSNPTKLEVLVYPSFTNTPSAVKVKTGQDAKFLCNASGDPPPSIKWSKDGGEDFPAAKERRFQVHPDNLAEFIIKDVNWEDRGTYYCSAYNAAGSIVSNATLEVLVPPMITEPISCASTGQQNYALKCQAEGNPPPPIVWYKDGLAIQAGGKYVFSMSYSVPYSTLFIISAAKEDSGVYTCSASNTLGKITQSCSIDVDKTDIVTAGAEGRRYALDQSTITGLIVIAVVCCVVGTSLVWVVIIYKTRRRGNDNSSNNTEETNIPFISGDGRLANSMHKLGSESTSDASRSDHYFDMAGQTTRGTPPMFGPSSRLLRQANLTSAEILADPDLLEASQPLTSSTTNVTKEPPKGIQNATASQMSERYHPFSTFQPNRAYRINNGRGTPQGQHQILHSKSTDNIHSINRNRPPPDISHMLHQLKTPGGQPPVQPPHAVVIPVIHHHRARLRVPSDSAPNQCNADYENLPPAATMPKSCKSSSISNYMNIEPREAPIYLNTAALDIRPGLVLDNTQAQLPLPKTEKPEQNKETVLEANDTTKSKSRTPTTLSPCEKPASVPQTNTASMSRTHKHPRKGVHSDALAHTVTPSRREALADALEKKYNLNFTNESDPSQASVTSQLSEATSSKSLASRNTD